MADHKVQHQRMLDDIDRHGYRGSGTYRGQRWEIRRNNGTFLCGYVWLPNATDALLDKLEPLTHDGWSFRSEVEEKYGFDCARLGDYPPPVPSAPDAIYRDWNYVKRCIKKIIDGYNLAFA